MPTSIQEKIDSVRRAFYDANPMPDPMPMMYVEDVLDDGTVIICQGETMWKVKYSTNSDGKISFAQKDEWKQVEETYVTVKAEIIPIKAGEDGWEVRILGVPFGGPFKGKDKDGEHFSNETNIHSDEFPTIPLVYAHGLNPQTGQPMKPQYIGKANYDGKDARGHWYRGFLKNASEFGKRIWDAAQKGVVGASSGSVAHLVRRGAGGHILEWPVVEMTLVELTGNVIPRNPYAIVMPVTKAFYEQAGMKLNIQEPEAPGKAAPTTHGSPTNKAGASMENETPEEKAAREAAEAAAAATKAAPSNSLKAMVETAMSVINDKLETEEKATKAEAEQRQAIIDMATAIAEKAIKAAKGQPADPLRMGAPAFNSKTKRGDDAFKAFAYFTATGKADAIHTGEAYDKWIRDQEVAIKTNYPLLESTQYQGQEPVPTEVVNVIVEKRDPISIARAAGATIYPAKSNAEVIPIEKGSAQKFGITTVDNDSGVFTTQTSQPLDKLAATIYLFTYNVPIDIQLIDDSVFSVDGWLSRRIGRGLGLTENQYFLMGSGSGQPQGAAYGSTLGVTSASASVFTAAEIVDQFYKVPGEYRDRLVWVMRGATEGGIRKLTSSTLPFIGTGGTQGAVGQQAGTNSLNAGTGWLVDPNARVYNSDEMDAVTTSKKPVLVGNFEAGYAIVERKGLTVLRDPYSDANKGIVNMWWYARLGGGIVNASALYHILTPTA